MMARINDSTNQICEEKQKKISKRNDLSYPGLVKAKCNFAVFSKPPTHMRDGWDLQDEIILKHAEKN